MSINNEIFGLGAIKSGNFGLPKVLLGNHYPRTLGPYND
jgi:hypothetical protein